MILSNEGKDKIFQYKQKIERIHDHLSCLIGNVKDNSSDMNEKRPNSNLDPGG